MPKRIRKGMVPNIRHIARNGVREGKTALQIAEDVEERYGELTPSRVAQIIKQEQRRNAVTESLIHQDKRRKVDWHKIPDCGRENSTIRAYFSIHYEDEDTGLMKHKGYEVTLQRKGSLGSIINSALAEVSELFKRMGSPVPQLRSTNTTGAKYYRIEYVECV